MGPNEKMLICHRTAQLMVPKGGNIQHAVNGILNHDKPGGLMDCTRRAQKFVKDAITAVQEACRLHNKPMMSDEEICGEILSRLPKSTSKLLEEKRRQLMKEGKI